MVEPINRYQRFIKTLLDNYEVHFIAQISINYSIYILLVINKK